MLKGKNLSMPDKKRIVVTGAAAGMGAAAARQLVERGVSVLAVDRNEAGLAALTATARGPGELVTAVADLTDANAVQGYVDLALNRWGGLDGAFHIAGWEGNLKPFAEQDLNEFDLCMAANARTVWYGMKAILPVLLQAGGGSIVNTGSYAAIRGGRFTAAYAASKHAVVGLSKSVAVEYGAANIRVNVVAPGTMDTRMARAMAATISPDDPQAGLKVMTDRIPRRKMGTPEEVAAVGVWLLTEAPDHLSGQVIPVDGARSAG